MIFSTSRVPIVRFLLPLLTSCCLYSTASAQQIPEPYTLQSADTKDNTRASLQHYDEVIARIPDKQAPAKAVALAQINIALHQAKKIAEHNLCEGKWGPRGKIHYRTGPSIQATSMPSQKTQQNWVYQSFREPVDSPCTAHVSRALFFQEMSRHLPEGFSIRPGGQSFAYSQGEALHASRPRLFAAK